MPGRAKTISWAWVTEDRLLKEGECELLYANLCPSAASADAMLRNGVDSSGEIIATLKTQSLTNLPLDLPEEIYLSKGLFVDVGSYVTGVLVIWKAVEE